MSEVKSVLHERHAAFDPFPPEHIPPPGTYITADEWEVINASQRPTGYVAALALLRITDKLMRSIVPPSYRGESDPRYDTLTQVAKIRRCCEIIEYQVKAKEAAEADE